MGKEHRKLRNLVVRPEQQLKMATWIAIGFITILLTLFIANLYLVIDKIHTLGIVYQLDPEMISAATSSIIESHFILGALIVVLALLIFVFSIQMTHKIFGPVVAIQTLIDELKEGKYGSQRTLRRGDHLVEIMENLNQLSKKLESKDGGPRG